MALRPTLASLTASLVLASAPAFASIEADETPSREEAASALHRAVTFFHDRVGGEAGGGYVWRVSDDLSRREGEGRAGPKTLWVQPPGTPTVGEAYLNAYDATAEPAYLDAARDTARALVLGQLHSGGWNYHADLDPDRRGELLYRRDLDGRLLPDPTSKPDRAIPSGWDQWKRRKHKGNLTVLDDDTTQAAARFLIRLDRTLEFRDETIHEASLFALMSLLNAQYPNGGWSASFDRFPDPAPSREDYPPARASYPDDWSRTWPKDFTGCYVLNDNLMSDMIATLLLAHDVYGDAAYLDSARRAGDFLLLAQMPEPQPAWAQQYDRAMHPVWSRKFEPPAVSGGESQRVMLALIDLAGRTGDARYLAPIEPALAYLRRSLLPDGRLARFYELETNRPLYFTRDYRLTHDADDLPTHYGFLVDQRLDAIASRLRRAKDAQGPTRHQPPSRPSLTPALHSRARDAIAALDDRGAWVERGNLKSDPGGPASDVIQSSTFARNVATLADFLRASAP